MIFLDSNIPMSLVGNNVDWKLRAQHLLQRAILEDERIVTDVEVLQEILHRYLAIRRAEYIEPAYRVTLRVCDEVLPVSKEIMLRAKDLALNMAEGVSSRDALHLAVMQHHGIERILTFDQDFDRLGVERVH